MVERLAKPGRDGEGGIPELGARQDPGRGH
jgi:hypothetical protein